MKGALGGEGGTSRCWLGLEEEKAGQYGGTLHNSVLIYRLAHLAPSQRAIALALLRLEPGRAEKRPEDREDNVEGN